MRCLILVLAMVASASIGQTPHSSLPDPADTIIVTGRSGAVMRSYLDRVARPEGGHQLARWHAPLCIRFDGLGGDYVRFIQARIAETARGVGVAVANSPCPTAILVKLTDHADALASALVHRHRPPVGNLTSAGILPPRLVKAIETPRPVRWLTASATVSNDGVAITDGVNQIWMASLIASPTREDLHSKIIIIDAARLADVTLDQLADYLAFITLASPDLAADFTGTDSIMALFGSAGRSTARMTRQDRAFLDALYTAPADRPVSQQLRTIRARVAKGVIGRRNEGDSSRE